MRKEVAGKILIGVALGALLVAAIGCGGGKPTPTETAADFYKDKVFTTIIGFPAGGSFDIQARVMAPYLGKYSGTTAIAQNMSGAGTLIALNFMYNTAKPDGLTLMYISLFNTVFFEGQKLEGVKYKAKDFIYLAKTTGAPAMCWVSSKGRYQTVADLLKASEVKIFTAGAGTGSENEAALLSLALGMGPDKAKLIYYPGTAPAQVALLQGEIDIMTASDSQGLPMLRSGEFKAVVAIGRARSVQIPDVPTIFEAVPTVQNKELVDALAPFVGDVRGYLAPPGVPADRIAFLEGVIAKMMQDSQLKADLEKQFTIVDYLNRSDLATYINSALQVTEADWTKINDAEKQYRPK